MTEWYRQTDWSDDIEAAFHAKLARARSQRDQYIVIQAITLSESRPDVALRLVDYYFETRTDDFHDDRARLARSLAQFASGGYVEALDSYLETLKADPDTTGLAVSSPLSFAYIAARYRSTTHYAAALEFLSDLPEPPAALPALVFQAKAARALILHETGADPAGALSAARSALEAPEPVLSTYSDVVWRLRGITRN